jgi:hypothetical protein
MSGIKSLGTQFNMVYACGAAACYSQLAKAAAACAAEVACAWLALLVFKTSVRLAKSRVGSIPMHLRHQSAQTALPGRTTPLQQQLALFGFFVDSLTFFPQCVLPPVCS